MTETYKQYRLNSTEEPTDEMLQELMQDVAADAANRVPRQRQRKKEG